MQPDRTAELTRFLDRAHPRARRRDGHDDPACQLDRGATSAARASTTIRTTSRATTICSSLTQPDVIARRSTTRISTAGADIIETNTFNATRSRRPTTGSKRRCARSTSRRRASRASAPTRWTATTPDKPRFVAGALGPDQPHGVDLARRQRSGRAQRHVRRARRRVHRSGRRAGRRRRRPAARRDDLRHAERQGRAVRDRAGVRARAARGCRSSSRARSPMHRAARCPARRPRRSGTRCATCGRSPSASTARSARR